MKQLFLLACLWICIGSEYISYNGFKTFEVYPRNQQQLEFLTGLAQNHGHDIWSLSAPGSPSTIMVAPEAQARFIRILNKTNVPHSVLIENVGSVIRAERSLQNNIQKLSDGTINFTEFHRYDTIMGYLLRLSKMYRDIVSLVPPGTTYEGRKVQPIKIGTGGKNKPIILIDGGIHAREWISPAVVLYIIQELVENVNNRHMIEKVDWYIIPLLNPDGYEFSHTKSRLWRKNRYPNKNILNCTGTGVDLNRNFNLSWTSDGRYGDPCDDLYSGKSPFDQNETQLLRDLVQQYSTNIKLYITVHSYGKMILFPWGYTKELAANDKVLRNLGKKVRDAIANKSGTKYVVNSISHQHIIGLTYGSSVDWVKGAAGVNLTYAIELPGKHFIFPTENIMDVCKETFEAFKTFHRYVEKNCYANSNLC